MKNNIKLPVNRFRVAMPARQRGMATILTALFIGLAVTVTALSIVNEIRSTQERELSAHAQTNSQSAVWTAVEALRLHFLTLDEAALTAFAAEYPRASDPVSISGVLNGENDSVSAYVNSIVANEVVDPDPDAPTVFDGSFNLSMSVTARDSLAQSASTLAVVFKVTPAIPSDAQFVKPGINLRKQSSAGGDVTANMPEGADFTVDGSMALGGSAVTKMGGRPFGVIGATDDITITSDIHADKIHSNGNVSITASATATEVWSAGEVSEGKGTVTITGDSGIIDDVWANNDVVIESDGEFKVVRGRGTVTASRNARLTNYVKASSELVTASPYSANAVTLSGLAVAANVYAKGALSYIDDGNPTGLLKSQVSVNCGGSGNKPADGALAIEVLGCVDENDVAIDAQAETVIVDAVKEVTKFKMPEAQEIDTYTLYSEAHYAFRRVDGKDQVTVNNINGITPGAYYLGSIGAGNREYICDAVTDAGKCEGPYIYADYHKYRGGDQVVYNGALYSIANEEPGLPGPSNSAWTLLDSDPAAAVNPVGSICGKAETNGCFSYAEPAAHASGNGLDVDGGWQVDSSAGIAPGVVWFDTHVSVSGIMFNSILSMGDIAAGGSGQAIVAVNWGGQALMCDMESSFTYINSTSTTEVNNGQLVYADANNNDINEFEEIVFIDKNTTTVSINANQYGDQFLIDYCGIDGNSFKAKPGSGNVALMAGSYIDDLTNTSDVRSLFQGGHISIGTGSEILGMVMAGDIITTSGNTVIYGYITAVGQGDGDANSFGGTTTIDTRFLSDEMRELLGQWKSTFTPEVPGASAVLWSYYL